ncbi:hypothetical protein VNO78_09301 [Psophocarpus tetragonolobus]|uniref:chorismate mutase n=1 Tax=Psophocarpus tetragonolobus TaxID=3891 RepID=A0AAN9XUA8_PSOTE
MEAVLWFNYSHLVAKPISYFPSKSTIFLRHNRLSMKGSPVITSSSSSLFPFRFEILTCLQKQFLIESYAEETVLNSSCVGLPSPCPSGIKSDVRASFTKPHLCYEKSGLESTQSRIFRNQKRILPQQEMDSILLSCGSTLSNFFLYRDSSKKRVDESKTLTLEGIRHSMNLQEDSTIFSLLERAQYSYNADAYNKDAFRMDGFNGSLVQYMVLETEKLHAQVGRYKSPDEHAFFPEHLPEPMLPPMQYPQVLHHNADSININNTIWNMYFKDLLPRLVEAGENGDSGSIAVCDTLCLQTLSKRIHYGKFVAEAKFQDAPSTFEAAIKAKNRKLLLELLTNETIEALAKRRIELKARAYGQEVKINDAGDVASPVFKIKPSLIANLYADWVMPLTTEVQVEYLLRRFD